MEASPPPCILITKKLRQLFRIVYFMIRKGIISKRKLILDLHLLFKRSKFIGKSISNFLTFNNNRDNPLEVEFSCNHTLSYPNFHVKKRKNRNYEAAAIARAFEMMMNDENISDCESVMPSPSPVVWGNSGMARQLRVTDSPFPIKEEEEMDDNRVDEQAEDFIRRFYEQLRIQQQMYC